MSLIEISVFFLANIGTIGLGLGGIFVWLSKESIGAAINIGVKKYENGIKEASEQRMEVYRTELKMTLEKDLEENRNYLNKLAENFNLYNTERHGVYKELYSYAFNTESQIFLINGSFLEKTFEDFNRQDIDFYMLERSVPEKVTQRILESYDSDPEKGISDMKNYLKKAITIPKAQVKIVEFHNHLVSNEIYLSDKVSDMSHDLVKEFNILFWELRKPYEKQVIRKDVIKRKKTTLKNQIKFELSQGNIHLEN